MFMKKELRMLMHCLWSPFPVALHWPAILLCSLCPNLLPVSLVNLPSVLNVSLSFIGLLLSALFSIAASRVVRSATFSNHCSVCGSPTPQNQVPQARHHTCASVLLGVLLGGTRQPWHLSPRDDCQTLVCLTTLHLFRLWFCRRAIRDVTVSRLVALKRIPHLTADQSDGTPRPFGAVWQQPYRPNLSGPRSHANEDPTAPLWPPLRHHLPRGHLHRNTRTNLQVKR